MKRYIIIAILIASSYLSFSIIPSLAQNQPLEQSVRAGDHFAFDGGSLYQRPGCVPQLVVSGTHYQMGRQYGVLLRAEIKHTADLLNRMITLMAKQEHFPVWLVKWYVQREAKVIASKLPQRFKEEIQGIAEGSGVPYNQILQVTMSYDIFRLRGCTGVILRGPDGAIIHGHTTDIGWGLDWPQTIIVQYHPQGYHAFTSITWAGFLGTQTAYNAAGLGYSENTLTAKKINSHGFSVNYLARMIMEECGSLAETKALFNKYPTINGEALVISDIPHHTAGIAETTPLEPVRWDLVPMQGDRLWGINLYQNPDFAANVQDNYQTTNGSNAERIKILESYFRNDTLQNHTVDSVIHILSSSVGPDGKDYAKSVYQEGICNTNTLQMLVYDPAGKGVYLATGPYYASRNAIYYYPDDITTSPHLYREKIPLEPVVAEAAQVINSITSLEKQHQQWRNLTEKYPGEAFVWDYAGMTALAMGKKDEWTVQKIKAYTLEPELPEHQVAAACVAYYRKDYPQTIKLLENLKPENLLTLNYQALRLALLANTYQMKDSKTATLYWNQLNSLDKQYPPLQPWVDQFLARLE